MTSPACTRASDLARVIRSGSLADARAFVGEAYAPEFVASFPAGMHLNFLARLQERLQGCDVTSVEALNPGEALLYLSGGVINDQQALMLRVEEPAPHRIVGLTLVERRAGPAEAARAAPSGDDVRHDLAAYFAKLAERDLFSGAVLVAKDGRPLFQGVCGQANKDFGVPNNIETRFNLGSMNKMFTSVAIAQLVEQGGLALDSPLSGFLPAFPTPEDAGKVQIRHLLCHTSGLGSYFNQKFMRSSRALFRTVDDLMTLVDGERLRFEPGTRYSYSNTGMLVLGKVIEVATGRSYSDHVREAVFEPAGMTGTDCYALDQVNPNLAVGYEKEYTDAGVRFRNNLYEHVIRGGPAGGGYSTAGDLLRFATALRGGVLVSKRTLDLLHSPKPDLGSPDYGFGFAISGRGAIAGHAGGFTGISSNLDMFLRTGHVAVVLSNYGGASQPLVTRIRELLQASG